MPKNEVEVTIEGRQLKLTNLDKVLYPEVGFTKAQVIDYYTRIAPAILPHTRNHPLTLKRYPNGVDGEYFYEKNCPKHRPPWVQTATVWSGGNNRDMYYCMAQDVPTLVWLGNLASLEFHTSLSLASKLSEPRTLVFDLDPGPPATIVECCRVGLMLRDVFQEHGLESCAKTSGSKGLQLYVPLNSGADYNQTKVVSKGLAQLFEEHHPDLVVHKQLKELRTGRVLIDWSQNDEYKTTVNVYSLRARARPTVSTPVTWEEVTKCMKAGDPSLLVFDSDQVLARVKKLGDLFEPVVKKKQKLPKSLLEATGGVAALEKMANRRRGGPGRMRRPPANPRSYVLSRPRVVIAGAGFGGLTCARALKHAPVDVLLIDRHNYHVFTPLLYQVASALLDPGEIARPVRELIRPLRNTEFRQAEITGFDFEQKRVLSDRGPIAYDHLVLAAGSETDYFGNDVMAQKAFGLKQLDEALELRNRILDRFEASRWATDKEARGVLLTFVVVGGGPTGVEMAGALSELIRLVLRKDFPDLDLGEVRVILLEGAGALLGPFAPELREAALKSLERKGVEVMLDAKVKEVGEDRVTLADGREIRGGTLVWTAGVRASGLGKATGAALGRQSRITVGPTLQMPGHPEVYVIGDLAGASDGKAALPMLIPVAMQEGRYVASAIAARVQGKSTGEFRYKDPGIMATIGRNSAVAELGAVHLSGFLGWLMWLFVHLVNVVSFRSRILVLVNWAWEYLFYDRPVRLIVRARDGTRH